jgi:acyl carrier protein
MSSVEALELEIKKFIVETLGLEDVTAKDISSSEPLFGTGLGLDSIDALELGVALQKRYNIRLDPKDDETRRHFASVSALAALILNRGDSASNQ